MILSLRQASCSTPYVTGYHAGKQLGINSHILSRITGSIFVMMGAREQQPDTASKTNIGLNLKFNKRNEEVAGFTRKAEDNTWTYRLVGSLASWPGRYTI